MLLSCHDQSSENLALFIYNGLHGNRWKFFEDGSKLLLPSFERAATILNIFDLVTKSRSKVRLSFDFEADSVGILGFGPLDNSLLICKSNFYCSGRLGFVQDFRELFTNSSTALIVWEDVPDKIETEACGDFSSILRPGQVFERKIEFNDVTGFMWGKVESAENLENNF